MKRVSVNSLDDVMVEPRSVLAKVNYLAPECWNPSIHNGDFSKNNLPLQETEVRVLDASTFAAPPSVEREGFCTVKHSYDITGLAASDASHAAYIESLVPVIRSLCDADEIFMVPICNVRDQSATKIEKDTGKSMPAAFVHSDSTDRGMTISQEVFFGNADEGRKVKRLVRFNIWHLLSPGPTSCPLALCDARTVLPEDVIPGNAYFPSKDAYLESAFFHPNERFRWNYFSQLATDEVMVFKQYDTDPAYPKMVPHTAFIDPSAPADAHPRISIESRCVLRWFE